jgi:mannosyltransferase
MKSTFSNKKYLLKYYIPLFLVAINFIIKILYLDKMSIANDEPFSICIAQMDISSIISQLSKGNNPPLFEIILHYWIRLWGISPFSTRFLPFLFSVATVYLIYKISLDFFNHRIAILSGLIFTFANYQIYFSHETRVYSLFALLTAISMYAYLSLVKNRGSKTKFIVLTLANIFLCYSHFFGIFVPIIQIVSCLLFKEVRIKISKLCLVSFSILFVSYIPYLKVFFTRFIDSTTKGTWVPPASFEDLYTMLWRFSNSPVTTIVFITILLMATIKATLNQHDKISVYTKIIIVWFIFPYFIMFFSSLKYLSFNIPVFLDRYVIFISIGFYLLVAIATNYIFRRFKLKRYLMLFPVVFMLATCNPNVDNKRHVAELIAKVKELKTNKTFVYFTPDFFDINFAYYYNINYFKDFDKRNLTAKMRENLSSEHIYPIADPNQINTDLACDAERILFLDASNQYSQFAPTVFEKSFKLTHSYKYFEIFTLYEFEKK